MAYGGFERREERREFGFTSIGVILVLFIILVIVAKALII
jgi:hypothetical protein